MTDSEGTVYYTYDKVGNVLEVREEKDDGTVNAIKRTYDALNRVVTYTDYRDSHAIRYFVRIMRSGKQRAKMDHRLLSAFPED